MQFTRRERGLFLVLALFAATWALFMIAVKPAVGRIETLRRVIPEKNAALQQLRAKSAQYLTLKAGLDGLKRKANLGENGFELLTFLESTIKELGLTEKATAMQQEVSQPDSDYCETIVEVEMENLTFEQLVKFLLEVKSSNRFLRIKSLDTKKNVVNPNLLDTVIQISTLKPSKPMYNSSFLHRSSTVLKQNQEKQQKVSLYGSVPVSSQLSARMAKSLKSIMPSS